MKTQLTAEESAKLIELGVSPERASMCESSVAYGNGARGIMKVPETPIFTLTDILDIMPKEIEDYHLSIESFKVTHYVTYIRDNNDDYLIPHKDAPNSLSTRCLCGVWIKGM